MKLEEALKNLSPEEIETIKKLKPLKEPKVDLLSDGRIRLANLERSGRSFPFTFTVYDWTALNEYIPLVMEYIKNHNL